MKLENFAISKLGEFTSKLQLSKMLEISTRTLYQYHDIAMLIPDFESDYPSLTSDSPPLTQCELTRYQCWVLFALMLNCRRLPRSKVEESFLNNTNPTFNAKFTKKYFNSFEGELNNEYSAVCKVA